MSLEATDPHRALAAFPWGVEWGADTLHYFYPSFFHLSPNVQLQYLMKNI